MLLRAIAVLALSFACLAQEQPASEKAATESLAKECERLTAKYPLKFKLIVTVITKDAYGFYTPASALETRRIYIVDKGEKENIRTLRHEWRHAVQEQEGRKFDDEEARKAEDE